MKSFRAAFSLFLFCVLLLPAMAVAQDSEKIVRVGWLSPGSVESQTVLLDVLRAGLRDAGYVEGKNLVIEKRWADGKPERLPQLAKELAAAKVVAIVTVFTATAVAAKQAVSDVPILFTMVSDPVHAGLLKDLARPGGNVSGFASLNIQLAPKRLEILHEILPAVKKVAFLYSGGLETDRGKLEATIRAAGKMGLQVLPVDVQRMAFAEAFKGAVSSGAKAAIVVLNGSSFDARREIVALAAKHRMPAIYEAPPFVSEGGLLSYSVSQYAQIGRAAVYIDKLAKGAKVGDLPVEQAATLELVINATHAKELSIKIPQSIMLRATRVID